MNLQQIIQEAVTSIKVSELKVMLVFSRDLKFVSEQQGDI
jgi:hypothetical protein